MVSTRRPARSRESEGHVPAAGAQAELTSMEGSTSVKATKSRSKSNAHSEVTPDSGSEKMKESETKSGVEEPLATQKTLNRSKALHLADSVAELQADGDISEAESNCSSVSGLQTPMFIRITRRRKIMVPCQPESVTKSRKSKKVLPNEGGRNQDEDISEAESCSSTVSGVRAINTPRKSRSQQIKASVLPVCEAHTEEVSDAESWCSGVSSEPSVQFKRITRSMRVKPQVETTCQSEKKSELVVGDEKLPECATKSLPIVISDSEQPTKSDSETEKVSFSSAQNNEHRSPCKTKRHFDSVISNDSKQILSSSPKKMESTQKSSKKKSPENKDYKSCIDYNAKPPKTDTKRATQSCFHHTEEVIEVDKVPAGSPQNDNIPIQTVESSHDDCRVSVASEDSDGSQEEPVAESSSDATKKAVNEKSFFASLFISSESESENSDLEEINDMKVIASSSGTSSQNALALDTPNQEELFVIDKTPGTSIKNALALNTSNQEELFMIDKTPGTNTKNALALDTSNQELFVIDKTPGLNSSKAYYLEKDLVDDKESETSKESSELEVSEDEEDEDEDLLASNNKLGLFSTSIDPGLNIKELGGLYINFDVGKPKPASRGIVPLKEKKKDELLQKSVITPDFEKKECVPQKESAHQLKKQRKAEREKTTGDGWFGMKAPEMTEELKNDLQALKMRAAMDPKRFYKKNDRKGLPKYFQVGTIVDSAVDFYHARIPKKERKKNIVEELLADSEFRRYNKRKYQDIMAEKAALAAGKKKMKKKKFHK